MKQVYCELSESAMKFFKVSSKYITYEIDAEWPPGSKQKIMDFSQRIWVEEGGHVFFLKHRYSSPGSTVVDMKEFMWVKLKSKAI